MASVLSVSEISNEILQSILATSKKQRRIRSGTFWKKFGFERRTGERIESVKVALKDSKTKNCNDSFIRYRCLER
jgi:hypothetical protein